jgi:serine/threonine-protein kinase
MQIQLQTLPRFRILADGDELEDLLRQPVRSALLLCLAVERELTRDSAMALLWPERDSAHGRHALSQTIYELRREIGARSIRSSGNRLRVAEWVSADALDFEAAVRQESWGRALDLYRGPFLDGWHLVASSGFEAWVDLKRARFANLFREACRRYAAQCRARGDCRAALATVRSWIDVDPSDPDARLLLVQLLTEAGDLSGALAECSVYERWLKSEEIEAQGRSRLLARMRGVVDSAWGAALQASAAVPAGPEGRVPRLVVLPFEHLGEPGDQDFTNGITDEITSRLARLPGIAVIARTSAMQFAPGRATIQVIGEELAVDFAVEGTVRWDRSTGETRVMINTQVIRVADAVHVWAGSREAVLKDVFRIQADVADAVAAALDARLPADKPSGGRAAPTHRLDAYELYHRARHHWYRRTRESLLAAIDFFQQAVELDPGFARAYAGLAEAYAMMPAYGQAQPREWHPQARLLARRALELDPTAAEGHAAAGIVAYIYDWDFAAAERHLDRAAELAPSHVPAHVWRAYVLLTTGRAVEARAVMSAAHALDPLSVATNWDTGFHAWLLGDRDTAVRQFRRVLELNPGFDPAHFMIGALHFRDGDRAAARDAWRRIQRLGPPWAKLVEIMEDSDRVVRFLDNWTPVAPRPIHWYVVATLYAIFGRPDRALVWLDGHYRNVRGCAGALETCGANLAYAASDPFFDDLHTDPAFLELMRRIGANTQRPALKPL